MLTLTRFWLICISKTNTASMLIFTSIVYVHFAFVRYFCSASYFQGGVQQLCTHMVNKVGKRFVYLKQPVSRINQVCMWDRQSEKRTHRHTINDREGKLERCLCSWRQYLSHISFNQFKNKSAINNIGGFTGLCHKSSWEIHTFILTILLQNF